jgi:hypothetical protein
LPCRLRKNSLANSVAPFMKKSSSSSDSDEYNSSSSAASNYFVPYLAALFPVDLSDDDGDTMLQLLPFAINY